MNTDIHGIILLIIAALELLLLLYLLFTRSKGHIIYSFTIFTVGVIFWVMGNGIHRLVKTNEAAFFWTDINHFAAIIIAVGLVYLSLAFPYLEKKISNAVKTVLITIIILFAYLIFFTEIIVESITGPIDNRFQVIGPMYHFYAIVFLLLFIWAFINLFRKYKITEGIQRWQVGALLVGLMGSAIFGTLFDLFLPWFGGPQYFYLGPESSVIWLGFTSYIVFKEA